MPSFTSADRAYERHVLYGCRERVQAQSELDRLLARQARMDGGADALMSTKEATPA